MASNLLQKFLYRFLLPLTLLGACLLRYNALSGVYLFLLLLMPLLPSPGGSASKLGIFLQWIIFSVSTLFTFLHLVFQVVMVVQPSYGHYFNQCSNVSILIHQIGFNRYDHSSIVDAIRLLAPDVIVLFVSLIAVISSRYLPPVASLPPTEFPHSNEEVQYRIWELPKLEDILPIFVGLMMLFGGIIQPNVLSSVYFLTFLILGICWAFHLSDHMEQSPCYIFFKVLMTAYAGLHVLLIYLYQFSFLQHLLDPASFEPRLLGLPAIINSTNCMRSTELLFNQSLPWPFYIYPFMIFILYCCLAVDNKLKCRQRCQSEGRVLHPWWHPTAWHHKKKETSPLLIANHQAHQYGALEKEVGKKKKEVEPIQTQGTFSSIMIFLMRQSYIAALIIMMTWSILYHSWLTFVLLLWACITWITPFARWFCMASSPYLVVYSDLLLIIQYLYGMNLRDTELPVSEGTFHFSELGMTRSRYPVLHLGLQNLFTWVFLVTLRQHFHEKKMNRRKVITPHGAVVLTTLARPMIEAIRKKMSTAKSNKVENIEDLEHGISPSDDAKEFMIFLKSLLSKYWILCCCFAFLLVALQNDVSLFQIFYMVMFLMVFVIYQFSVRLWKAVLRPLWWFMVVFSIAMLLTVYTYQFENMPSQWQNATHLSGQLLYDIGLRQQGKASLLLELLVPTVFSITIVIQLHFFHKPLMMKVGRLIRSRKENHQLRPAIDETPTECITPVCEDKTNNPDSLAGAKGNLHNEVDEGSPQNGIAKIRNFYVKSTVVLWRIAEIHIPKLIYFITMLVVVQQISMINGIFIFFVALALPNKYLQRFVDYILILWSSVTVLVFMFYQLRFVNEELLDTNCTALTNKSFPTPEASSHFVSNAWWIGFHKVEAVGRDVRGYLFIVILIVLQKVVKHHQELYRYQMNIEKPPAGILFPGITRKQADETLTNALKYICNHFFDLFGIEINLMVMVLTMSIRCDFVAVIHSFWVAIFLIVRRKHLSKIWSFYVGYMTVFLPIQYLFILGWPPGLCKDYPWDRLTPHSIIQWLYLTDVANPQDPYLLVAEYFQLLVACCQANVFMKDAFGSNTKHLQTSSTSRCCENSDHYMPPDFMNNKTWLDFIKIIFLDQFIWLTLTILYLTAQSTTSLFNFGFMLGCFFFLWHGQGMYLRPRAQIKRWWKLLLSYIFFVIIAKVWLQLISCIYITSIYNKTNCYLIQLLNLYCERKDIYHIKVNHPMNNEECINEGDTGLVMDSICFMVVLIQYRIFHSAYFKYVVRDQRRQSDMASRGAQLVEERLQIRLMHSKQSDEENMAKIKKKVMKARKKLKQRQAQVNPTGEEPISHYEAIYSGDYYLFEDSETDSDSETKDGVDSSDVSLFVHPKATSEQQDQAASMENFIPEPSLIFHPLEEKKDEHDVAVIVSSVEAGGIDAPHYDGLRRRGKYRIKCDFDATRSLESANTECDFKSSTLETSNANTSFNTRTRNWFYALRKFSADFSQSSIKWLNNSSSDYRSITLQLAQERKEQLRRQQQSTFNASLEMVQKTHEMESSGSSNSNSKVEEDTDTWSVIDTADDNGETWKKHSIGVSLAVSFYYALLANTNWVCYTLMIVNHMYYASLLSMPLPIFIFLWGMLSIPRPTKAFWIAVITYVELVIVVKYILQFQFPESRHMNFNECDYYGDKAKVNPLCPPRIIGIERNQYSSVCDLLVLLSLFFHRLSLKSHGLWREKAWADEEDGTPCPNQGKNDDGHCANTEQKSADSIELQSSLLDEEEIQSTSQQRLILTNSAKGSLLGNIKNFFRRIWNPEVGTGAVDVYALMFGAQFIIFLIILFSWSAFSSKTQESNSNFAKIIEENAVPQTFLYLLLTWFLIIVFDRCLYMKKHVVAKLIYMVILVFVVHAFLFIIVPFLTGRGFTENIPAIFMYIFLCIYFALSSYQVRCGYPTRILGNFLTKNYTIVSGILFQGIQAIPFLLELRSVLDWVLTKTTLTLSHWLKMEDIHANIFVLKCWRDSEKTWFQKRGEPYSSTSKWLIGGILVILLVLVIWFPLLLMSFIKTAYISNRPVEVTFTLTVGGYQPLFKVTTQQQFLKDLTQREVNEIIEKNPQWDANKFGEALRNYRTRGNIMSIKILSNSSSIWTISPPSRDVLIKDLESNSSISLRFKYVFSREQSATQAAIVQETVSGVTTTPLDPNNPIRKEMVKVLRMKTGHGEIKLPNLFPMFLQVPASGPVKKVQWLGSGNLVNCTIILRRGSVPSMNTEVEWWEIIQDSPLSLFSHGPGYLDIIALNDFVPPLHLSFFASRGIIGLYVGFVWLVGKFVRLFFTSISYRIMFDEVPNVNRILKLCHEIYMARESKELELEEDLFAKLLFVYRSPETLIKWTKYKRLKTS